MVTLAKIYMLTGFLTLNGQALNNQQILIIAQGRVIQVSTTDTTGHFTCKTSEKEVQVIAKIRTDSVVTVHTQAVALPQKQPLRIDINMHHDFYKVDIEVKSKVGFPKLLDIQLNLTNIIGIAPQWNQHFNASSPRTRSSSYYQKTIRSSRHTLWLKKGTYRVNAEYIIHEGLTLGTDRPKNYVTEKATLLPSQSLEGKKYVGYTLEVSGDCKVLLHLRVLEDKELYGD